MALFAATTAKACPACGDKLSFGGGMNFERVHSGRPARIVVFAAPGSILESADTELGLAAELKRSGHDVKVVTSASELDRVVQEQGADVVVTHWTEAATTAEHLSKGEKSPTVVAVSYKPTDAAEATAAGVDKCVCAAEQRKGKELTKTIDKVLGKRRKGEPADCMLVASSHTT